jgi:hypothetical protein
VRVKTLVGTRERPDLFIKWKKKSRKPIPFKKEKKETKQIKNRVDNSLNDDNDDYPQHQEVEEERPKKISLVLQNRFSLPLTNRENGNDDDDNQSIDLGGKEQDMDALMNASDVNKSQDFLIVEKNNDDQQQQQQHESQFETLNFYSFWKNVNSLAFNEISPGVNATAINDREAIIRIDERAKTRTNKHDSQATIIVQQGHLLVSINGTKSLHSNRDIIRIPKSKFLDLLILYC